jgi:eukaryotic-like serine/threonine-protein kinase
LTQSAAPKNPEKFGRYEVEGLIGVGAMGRVYRGFDPLVRRAVAVKTFKADGHDPRAAAESLKRFGREAQAAGALSHPHIVSIFDVGEDYFVMEHLEGKTLQEVIDERGRLEAEEAFKLFAPIADALDYAHSKGVIHRDIKPGNIMVLPDGRPKLMDFGVAKVESSDMTKAGEVLGSPSYMAPEQIAGQEVTPLSDLFSLAAVIYQALTGRKPFEGETVTTVIYRVVHEDPPPPRTWNPALPDRYDDVFRRALAKDPAMRFRTAADLMAALDLRAFDIDSDVAFSMPSGPAAAAEPRPSGDHEETMTVRAMSPPRAPVPTPAVPPRRGPAPWVWAAGAIFLLAAAGLGVRSWRSGDAPPPPPPTPAGLRIETDPPGATVSVDGKEVGVSPLTLADVTPGLRTVRVFHDGYAPTELSLEVAPETALAPLHFSLQAVEARGTVTSEPSGAIVTVDGREAGKTPLDGLRLAPGPHDVRVEAAGYRSWRQRVEATAGQAVTLQARLVPQPAEKREPEPTPPPLKEGDLVEMGADVTPPQKISGETASYPRKAERNSMQGLVVVDMIVTEDGTPTDLRILESAGEVLDQAVMEAVKSWRFQPATKQGIKVKVHWQARHRFQIRQ